MSSRNRLRNSSGWIVALGPVVVVVFGSAFARYMLTRWPEITVDSAFFQHMGWYILQGAVPYVDAWDVNPPIPFGITAALAALSGGDMLVLHGLSVTLTVLVAASSVLLVGWVAHLLTGEDVVAVAAGLTMLVIPVLFVYPLGGVLSQVYALFFGVLSLAIALRDRPFLAGVVAALSAGSWQSGVAFAPLVVGIGYHRRGKRSALRTIAGGGAVAAVVVIVFAAADALVPMVVETVLAPLVAGAPSSPLERIFSIALAFGYGSLLVVVAIFGWVHAAVGGPRERWWVPVGGVLLAVQLLFVDLDGPADALPWLAFVALGVALAVERVLAWRRRSLDPRSPSLARSTRRWLSAVAVVAVAGLFVFSGLAWYTASPPPKATLQSMENQAEPMEPPLPVTPADGDVPPMRTIYWQKLEPETCHYRLSWNEVRWISRTDDRVDADECGAWPEWIDRDAYRTDEG